jgi:hypothetical protein
MAQETRNIQFDKHRRQFTDFIEFDVPPLLTPPTARLADPAVFSQEGRGTYMESIREMMQAGNRRLLLNLNDVRHFNPEMAQGILDAPAGADPHL